MEEYFKNLSKNLAQMVGMSSEITKSYAETAAKSYGTLADMPGMKGFPYASSKGNCCMPKQECPPHCLIQIVRHAYPGERIIIPFVVRNDCGGPRHYRVGVRPLKALNGAVAPSQPQLNKDEVTLNPGVGETVLMRLDLTGFSAGQAYETEIVIRERDINQNVCFRLIVDGFDDAPVVRPLDEKKYRLRWQGWESHFYCETSKTGRQ
jgi:hypothetical protein